MHLSRLLRRLGLGMVCGTAFAVAGAPQSEPLDPQVADAFGVQDGVIVSVELDFTQGIPTSIVVPIDGIDYTLDLVRHSVRDPDFMLVVQLADGSYVEEDPGPVRTLQGTVREIQGSEVTGSMLETGISAAIRLPDGELFWIEPIASRLAGFGADLYVIYNDADVLPNGGVSGTRQDEVRVGIARPSGIGSTSLGYTVEHDADVATGSAAICIVHGNPDWVRGDPNTHVPFGSWAFGGYIDPGQESTNSSDLDQGRFKFKVVFNVEPFGDAGSGPIGMRNVSVEETGGGPAPGLVSTVKEGNGIVVELDRIITLSEWTTLVFDVWSADGVRIVDTGNQGVGIDECARLDVGFQPADVNNDGKTQPLDLNRWIAAFLGVTHPPDVSKGTVADYLDISRNGFVQPQDLSRVIAALKGQAPFTRNWRGVSMNNTRP